ncbi:uncharacterized protein BO96DRAFT_407781 [Aspergillus niger CBS 101883]|uniref:uncharacterized protein n=1 Tax=Aspergillus lacticoffeatus (strain CBS 101883) TaxID=1450533 RepID=UPI000D803F30|nr:uncharacterized protein BO96DRAFT_407781 [Aspergillus niger CBS 101883]PYH63146.1 hypothetical protein BO96DRAFT_407781 [Aspergillus niger CBS 101883]
MTGVDLIEKDSHTVTSQGFDNETFRFRPASTPGKPFTTTQPVCSDYPGTKITDGAQYGKVRAEGLIWSSTIQTQQ